MRRKPYAGDSFVLCPIHNLVVLSTFVNVRLNAIGRDRSLLRSLVMMEEAPTVPPKLDLDFGDPQNLSADVSELHKIRRLTKFKALKF